MLPRPGASTALSMVAGGWCRRVHHQIGRTGRPISFSPIRNSPEKGSPAGPSGRNFGWGWESAGLPGRNAPRQTWPTMQARPGSPHAECRDRRCRPHRRRQAQREALGLASGRPRRRGPQGPGRAQQPRSRAGRRRHHGLRHAGRRPGPQHRPQRRARRRTGPRPCPPPPSTVSAAPASRPPTSPPRASWPAPTTSSSPPASRS